MRIPTLALLLSLAISAPAQSPETFKTRLAPVALDAAMKSTIAGTGSATATLTGTKFTVNGAFEGLKSNATMAHIHQGSAPGVRGPKLLDLTVTKSMSGTSRAPSTSPPTKSKASKKANGTCRFTVKKPPKEICGAGCFRRKKS